MANRNAIVIIPLAIAAWLGGIFVFQPGTPVALQVAFVVAFVIAIPVVVFYLMSSMGWSALARRFRATERFRGDWKAVPTGQMSTVSVDHPDFVKNRLRLVGGTLRVGSTPTALHLSMLLSRVPILGRFFPDVQIPWSSVTSARPFEAPGWFRPLREPGTVLQVGYDPNYTGTFVEIVVGEPPVFIQLPQAVVGEAASRVRPSPAG